MENLIIYQPLRNSNQMLEYIMSLNLIKQVTPLVDGIKEVLRSKDESTIDQLFKKFKSITREYKENLTLVPEKRRYFILRTSQPWRRKITIFNEDKLNNSSLILLPGDYVEDYIGESIKPKVMKFSKDNVGIDDLIKSNLQSIIKHGDKKCSIPLKKTARVVIAYMSLYWELHSSHKTSPKAVSKEDYCDRPYGRPN